MIELVFVVEEPAARYAAVVQRRMPQQVDIAARAEPASFSVVKDHRLDPVVSRPLGQRRAHRVAHVERQRMERLGPVE